MHERRDSSGAFVLALAGGPFLLPVLGIDLRDLIFAVPLVLAAWATTQCVAAARRRPERRAAWLSLAVAGAITVGASLLAVVTAVSGAEGPAALYVGLAASLALVCGYGLMARQALGARGWAVLVDPLLPAGAVASLFVFLLVLPGVDRGDVVLTTVLVADLVAFLLAATTAAGPAFAPVRWRLLGAALVVCAADGLALAATLGIGVDAGLITPVLWGVTCVLLAAAAGAELRGEPERQDGPDPELSNGRVYARALMPLGAIVGYPIVIGLVSVGRDGDWVGPVVFFGPLFLASTAIAFARQAVFLVEQRRAAVRERALSSEALRRNRQLEALAGLAATVTEVLDERPVVARGLEALELAAHTSSSALHLLREDGRLELVATTGEWGRDREWARVPAAVPDAPSLDRRGRRFVARLPLVARGCVLGMVTLVRPERRGTYQGEFRLLALLADQLAVALQNTRDYHDKREAAIRDPLTGLHNRRYFYEAFATEVARHERYGTPAALVLFDVDDFKQINDTLGHQAGDAVLEAIGQVVAQLVRPSDTFARIGGEEFGLLMPETGQLDALLVAERLRTAVARHGILAGRTVTLSGGVAALPQDGVTREELQRRADEALYWAKRNGKNMCAVASEAIAEDAETVQSGMLAHLHGVVAGIDAEQLHTRDHSENVAAYAVAIGQELGLDPERIVRIRRAALLHDIGKVAVSHAILGKPAALTAEEFEAIKVHPRVGETMLHHAGLHEEARWVGAHHERLDGQGYPQGLSAAEIPLEARIIFVADSFEAMTSDRPYHQGMPVADAVEELRRCAGTQFDPEVVETLAALVQRDRLAVLALRDA